MGRNRLDLLGRFRHGIALLTQPMEAEDPQPQKQRLPLEFTLEQLSLLAELAKVEGGFNLDKMLRGAFYALRQDDNPESFVHAAQSVRELMERFERAMYGVPEKGVQEPQRPTIKSKVDVYSKVWSRAKSDSRATAKDGWKGKVDAPLKVFLDATEDFFNWYANDPIYRKNKEEAVVHALDPMFSALSGDDQERVRREWVGLRKFFNGVAHHHVEEVTKEMMEDALARLVRYLHRRLAPVDAKNKEAIRVHIRAWEKNGVTDEAVKALPAMLDSGADTAFFFNTIGSGEWLPVLGRAGYFKSPPPPRPGVENVQHPWWPEIVCLIRLTGTAPAEVAKTLAGIATTENLHVNEYLVRAASALPPEHVGPVVSRVRRLIKTPGVRLDAHSLTKFVQNVARSQNISGALGMLEDLLSFRRADDSTGRRVKKRSNVGVWSEPTNRLGSHEYIEFLKSVLPILAEADSRKTLTTLFRILDDFVCAKDPQGNRRGYDGSVHWRPAVDGSNEDVFHDRIAHVISAIRSVGDDGLRAGRLTLAEVLQITRAYKWDIFRRLELHWMKVALDQVSAGELRTVLVTRATLQSGCCDPEFGLLLQAAFTRLKRQDRQVLLRWIAKGPAMGLGKSAVAGSKKTQEAKDWADKWRAKKAYWIKDHLPPAFRAKYDVWVANGWEPKHPAEPTWGTQIESVVARSPMVPAEFQALPLPQQVDFLRSWVPTGNMWNEPSREGLAGVLRAAISQNLPIYLEQAQQFIGVPPEYITAYFSTLGQKLKEGVTGPMTSVWALAKWMLQQPDDEGDLPDGWTGQMRRVRPWYSAKLELARLLLDLLRTKANPLPLTERENVWALIEGLAADPDPSPQHQGEHGDDQNHMGPFTLSLNTIRGEAFHAVFAYISWCYDSSPDREAGGLPVEVKRLLERHLDPGIEPTLTVRSVYGVNVNGIFGWDTAWFRENWLRIFPGVAHPRLDAIAWSTFISHSRASIRVFGAMRDVFDRAVREVVRPKTMTSDSDPRVMLGNYLVALYWQGHLACTSENDLLAKFFKLAPDEVRAGVIEFIGRALQSTKTEIEKEIADRLRGFWEWRVKVARTHPKSHAAEIGVFAWWFYSGKLDAKWAAEQMVESLVLSGRHENQSLWMDGFAKLAGSETALAVRGLKVTVDNVRRAKSTFWSDEEATLILKAGLKSSDAAVVDRAKRVQDALLRSGHNQFLDVS